MPLILITGISTSGKSTMAVELTKRGYEAYDTEHNGIGAWFNKETGGRAAEFGKVPSRTAGWMNQHHWLISEDWVKQRATEAKDRAVFLCGGSSDVSNIVPLLDTIIWLKTDEATIRKRVNNPRDHTYGTKPHELEKILKENLEQEQQYKDLGAAMVDARKPLDEVVIEVMESSGL
ncbi:MAG: hypothetical protein U0520_02285 [Candidatus Saccharimonadales bacterium]